MDLFLIQFSRVFPLSDSRVLLSPIRTSSALLHALQLVCATHPQHSPVSLPLSEVRTSTTISFHETFYPRYREEAHPSKHQQVSPSQPHSMWPRQIPSCPKLKSSESLWNRAFDFFKNRKKLSFPLRTPKTSHETIITQDSCSYRIYNFITVWEDAHMQIAGRVEQRSTVSRFSIKDASHWKSAMPLSCPAFPGEPN